MYEPHLPPSGQIPMTFSFEHANDVLGSKNGGEFLYQLSDCQLLNEDSAP